MNDEEIKLYILYMFVLLIVLLLLPITLDMIIIVMLSGFILCQHFTISDREWWIKEQQKTVDRMRKKYEKDTGTKLDRYY